MILGVLMTTTPSSSSFTQRKAQFIAELLAEREGGDAVQRVTADELSVFYKQFLNDKYQTHMRYLR